MKSNGLMVAEATYESITVQSVGSSGARAASIPEVSGALGDYAEAGNVKAAIVATAEGQEVFLLSDDIVQLTSDGLQKASLALSADGTMLAYAALTDPREDGFILSTSRWTVRVVDIASGQSRDLGTGFGPEFFVRDGISYLLYTTPTTLAVFNTQAMKGHQTFFFTPSAIDYTARVSADGSHFAIRAATTGQFVIYSIDSLEGTLASTPVQTIEPILTDAQWVDGALYGLTESADGMVSVLKTAVGGEAPEEVGSFEGAGIYRFIR